jgi:hypothetical protein
MADDTIARQEQALAQTAASPIVEVLGVVSANGATGARGGQEELWSGSFTLDAWRVVGGKLQTVPMYVGRKMTQEELDRLRLEVRPYSVVRVKARIGENAFGGGSALLETYLGVDTSDAELNHHAEELQKPVTFDDPTFGTFTLDRSVDWFEAEVVWDGIPIRLTLSESAEAQEALETARELWREQSEWSRRIREFAVQELLPLKNENWLNEDEVELTPDDFTGCMKLTSISVSADGSFEFWHDDGDMFGGHAIKISGNLTDGPTRADIPG